ncbi:MAG TPA: 4-hydroxy-tetrahydrodipicolinate reductase [Acidimicrobiales bacterium]|nr:4-hydroxy-tetrahydrodipicolinate reductase [Acidimicrobiales bacterium]
MIRVGVFGATGRMGATVCEAVLAAPDLELVAAVDPARAGDRLAGVLGGGRDLPGGDLEVAGDAEALSRAGSDVAVDFTVAAAARENLRWCSEHSVHAVVGTTGFDEEDLARFAEWFGPGSTANAVVAANFSIGAALMMRCAELCAPYFEGIEVIELHHARKRDAPSGTSMATARRMEAARAAAGSPPLVADPTEQEVVPGVRGGASVGGVRLHSVRLPGLVAHQEVLFGSAGETLTMRHDSTDRVSFMPGVLMAVRAVAGLPGLTIGLDRLLGS